MGLTQRILLLTSLLVIVLVGTSLAFSTVQANRLAYDTILAGLNDTRGVWETFQADRFNRLALGVRVLANDAPFKAAMQTDRATVFDMLQERGEDLGATFVIATDPAGIVIARSDRPTAQGEDLSQDPLVMKPLAGEASASVWPQSGKLYHAVSVPMRFGADIVGVLIAGYDIDEPLANQIRRLTQSEIAYLIRAQGQPPQLTVSSLGPREPALRGALARPEFTSAEGTPDPFELDLGGERHVGFVLPIKSLAGESVGAMVALRSLRQEMASFSQFRNSLILVSLVVMLAGLAIAYIVASRIAGPVRSLVSLVERARDGSYAGAVIVTSNDEIGTLGRIFNALLADLREKEQMVQFLRESMTLMRIGSTTVKPEPDDLTTAATVVMTGQPDVEGQQGGLFAGRFEILGRLGRGGMGVVYRARDTQLDEVVALKVLHPGLIRSDPTLLERFKQEIKLARKITHRNVVRTHDFGDANGIPYISMEYVKGITLKQLMQDKGALPVPVGMRIAKQMCQGLEAAHRQGVVHRDIKPQNMLILPEGGELKIVDFGLARVHEVKGAAAAGLTVQGTVLGTPDYMPPEQAQGHPTDYRSDIYSLGIVLFEVFSGELPFRGDTLMAVMLEHIRTPPPRPRTMNTAIPVDLETVILRCLEKDPSRRYDQVADLLEQLDAVSYVEASVA